MRIDFRWTMEKVIVSGAGGNRRNKEAGASDRGGTKYSFKGDMSLETSFWSSGVREFERGSLEEEDDKEEVGCRVNIGNNREAGGLEDYHKGKLSGSE